MLLARLSLFLFSWGGRGLAVEIVSEIRPGNCEPLTLYRELKVYRDPALLLSNMAAVLSDPGLGWKLLQSESPVLTTVKGKFEMVRLGAPRRFNNFASVARAYAAADPRLQMGEGESEGQEVASILPIKICGTQSAYNDFLGFVLEAELGQALVRRAEGNAMPPSTAGNPIPQLTTTPPAE